MAIVPRHQGPARSRSPAHPRHEDTAQRANARFQQLRRLMAGGPSRRRPGARSAPSLRDSGISSARARGHNVVRLHAVRAADVKSMPVGVTGIGWSCRSGTSEARLRTSATEGGGGVTRLQRRRRAGPPRPRWTSSVQPERRDLMQAVRALAPGCRSLRPTRAAPAPRLPGARATS